MGTSAPRPIAEWNPLFEIWEFEECWKEAGYCVCRREGVACSARRRLGNKPVSQSSAKDIS
jgi:hypothetical protein